MTNLQEPVQKVLDSVVASGQERGVQVAVYLDGALVVDACAGIADPVAGKPVTPDTLFPVYSTTKGIVATIMHLLVERGKLAYETKIADLWPEFEAHGKGAITLRQALNHTAGLSHMPVGLDASALCDWEGMCTAIANLRPTSAPGAEMHYHAITFGWILGETARRADGRTFERLVQEEICMPLGIHHLFVGIPDEVESSVAVLEQVKEDKEEVLPNNAEPQAIPAYVMPLVDLMNRPDVRRACIPATNGIMSAKAIARHYAALLPGGVDGVELLPPERIRVATTLPEYPVDMPKPMAMGYQSGCYTSSAGFGHGGYGGSSGFADLEHRLAFGFTRNRFSQENSLRAVVDELKRVAGIQ